MTLSFLLYLLTGLALAAFFALFARSALREHKPRAFSLSVTAAAVIIFIWLGSTLVRPISETAMLSVVIAVAALALLFFAPIGRTRPMKMGNITERVDERDTMFAREEYAPGSDKHTQYYAMHPENKRIDDKIRSLPQLLSPGGRYYDPEASARVVATFRTIADMTIHVVGPVASRDNSPDPEIATAWVKQFLKRLGANDVGIAQLNPMHVYSHVGRGPEPWGRPIDLNHKFVIVFTLEMDYDAVDTAPRLPAVEETAAKYLQAANISVPFARLIREMGFPARAHISDSNYQVILPAVAHDAGLGEIGRLGYLISPTLGPRLRLGAVTTDLPLVPDKPISFGVQEFCATCLKCAENCPPNAIPHGDKEIVRGVEKWLLNSEMCLYYWRVVGTDCGLCMRVCPYSHPATPVHNVVRYAIKRSAVARKVSVWGDNLMYGRKVPAARNERQIPPTS